MDGVESKKLIENWNIHSRRNISVDVLYSSSIRPLHPKCRYSCSIVPQGHGGLWQPFLGLGGVDCLVRRTSLSHKIYLYFDATLMSLILGDWKPEKTYQLESRLQFIEVDRT